MEYLAWFGVFLFFVFILRDYKQIQNIGKKDDSKFKTPSFTKENVINSLDNNPSNTQIDYEFLKSLDEKFPDTNYSSINKSPNIFLDDILKNFISVIWFIFKAIFFLGILAGLIALIIAFPLATIIILLILILLK